MYCTNCGSEIADNTEFCTFCGERIGKSIPHRNQPTEPSTPIEPSPPTRTPPIYPSIPRRSKSNVLSVLALVLIVGLILLGIGLASVYGGSFSYTGITLLVIRAVIVLCIGGSLCGGGRGGSNWGGLACCACSSCDCGDCDRDC